MKDMNSTVDLYRANAVRVLCQIVDGQLLAQIERYLKQAVVDKRCGTHLHAHTSTHLCCSGHGGGGPLLHPWRLATIMPRLQLPHWRSVQQQELLLTCRLCLSPLPCSPVVAASVLCCAVHLMSNNSDIIKRWVNEVQEAVQVRSSAAQTHIRAAARWQRAPQAASGGCSGARSSRAVSRRAKASRCRQQQRG